MEGLAIMAEEQGAKPQKQKQPKPLTAIDTYLQKVKIWVVQNHYTAHLLAKEANLSPGTLRYLWRAGWNPTVETLRAIEMLMIRKEAEKRAAAASQSPQSETVSEVPPKPRSEDEPKH